MCAKTQDERVRAAHGICWNGSEHHELLIIWDAESNSLPLMCVCFKYANNLQYEILCEHFAPIAERAFGRTQNGF